MIYKTLIYIGVTDSAVFNSQVISLLQKIKDKRFFNRIILLCGVNENQNWNSVLSDFENTELEIILFKKFPNYHFFSPKQKKEFYYLLKRILTNNTIIHIRGESFTTVIKQTINRLNYKNVRVLTDVRGAIYEETQLYNRLKPVQKQLKLYQLKKNTNALGKNSDSISCVSKYLRKFILQRTAMDKNKVFVNHCVAGGDFYFSKKTRLKYRNKLKLSNTDIVFVFATGGDKKWENTEAIINGIIQKNYKIINLSKRDINLKNVINLFVPYREVANYLNAADIGVIWRNNDIVNNVASPVKLSEYACCGLPIVANNGVCLINDYLSNNGCGKIVNGFDEITPTVINRLISLDRNEISQCALKLFSSEIIANNYIKIYDKLLCLS